MHHDDSDNGTDYRRRVVAYVPDVPRQQRYRLEIIDKCRRENALVVATVHDPAEARRMRESGEVDQIAFARHAHIPDVYPELLVAEIPRQRPGRHAVLGGATAGVGAALAGLWGRLRQQPAWAATAAAAGAAVVVGAGNEQRPTHGTRTVTRDRAQRFLMSSSDLPALWLHIAWTLPSGETDSRMLRLPLRVQA